MHGFSGWDILSFAGDLLALLTYHWLLTNRIKAEGATYPFLNILASMTCVSSLVTHFSLSYLIVQSVWLFISVHCLYKHYRFISTKQDQSDSSLMAETSQKSL